jgi:hypothetical protein
LPPFLSTLNTWMSSGFVENGISKWRAKNFFLRSDPSGPRSTYTTNQTINRLICSRIDDNLLCKFSQNVLQKDMLRENTWELFCCCRPSGPPRREAPRHISPACTTNQYLPFGSV